MSEKMTDPWIPKVGDSVVYRSAAGAEAGTVTAVISASLVRVRYGDEESAKATYTRDLQPSSPAPTFTCPVCGAVSYHPDDVRFGYCGRCHQFTGGI